MQSSWFELPGIGGKVGFRVSNRIDGNKKHTLKHIMVELNIRDKEYSEGKK